MEFGADQGRPVSEGTGFTMSRRALLGVVSLLPLAAAVPELLAEARAADSKSPWHFFTSPQAAVVDAATRRIAPGPDDDPLEAGHPGAGEANVVRYIDTMLSLFTFSPPRLFTGGPFSNRPAGGIDYMARFTPPDTAQERAWRQRIGALRTEYAKGVSMLDAAAGGSFTAQPAVIQDRILASSQVAGFTSTLFQHTIEGMYSVPEYGGNANLVGWKEIGWPGDRHPKGFTADEMSRKTSSVIDPSGITGQVLANFEEIARAMGSHKARRA